MYRPQVLIILYLVFLLPTSSTETRSLCEYEPSNSNLNESTYKYKNVAVQNCNCTRNKEKCVRKCCAFGFNMARGVCIRSPQASGEFVVPVYDRKRLVRNMSVLAENPGMLVGVLGCDFYLLKNSNDDWIRYQLDGTLFTSNYGFLDNNEFCLDYLATGEFAAFICYGEKIATAEDSRNVLAIGMMISIPFLLATFIVYALLPERNLHMKALMNYVITLMMSYIFLIINQVSVDSLDAVPCHIIGFGILFFFLTSCLWMNVICIDIWLTFRGMWNNRKESEKKRFWYYCGYAWGMSTLLVTIAIIINIVYPNSIYSPGIGSSKCYLQSGYPELIYIYGPMAFMIVVNITLFAITAHKIWSIKKDTAVLRKDENSKHTQEKDKQTFYLYLRLLFAMGLNWSMELTSWVVGLYGQVPAAVWYFTDFFNAMYGVIIFFMFVFKRSIWKQLKKRYYSFMGRPYLAHAMSNTRTRSTHYSTTTSALSTTEA